MLSRPHLTFAGFLGVMAVSCLASAAPITFRIAGEITGKEGRDSDEFCDRDTGCRAPSLREIYIGMPWELLVTFDPDTPGDAWWGGDSVFLYPAISGATFKLGDYVYTHPGFEGPLQSYSTFIGVNFYLPLGVAAPGTGLVQIHINGGWTSDDGGPALSPGLMVVTWRDQDAIDGSLPSSTDSAAPSAFFWQYLPDTCCLGFGSDTFAMSDVEPPAPVPEPSTLVFLGAGLVIAARSRFTR